MKKLNYLFLGLLILALSGMVSCSKDEANPQDNPPSIQLQQGPGYTWQDGTVTVNDSLKFGIRSTVNSTTSAAIKTLTFTRTFNGQDYKQDFNLTSKDVDLTTKANSQAGQETYTFKITDEKGATATTKIVLTTVIPGDSPARPAGTDKIPAVTVVSVR